MSTLAALKTVLGIQATACFAAAGIAWIPWAGDVPMGVILAALIIQAALIATLIGFWIAVATCLQGTVIAYVYVTGVGVGVFTLIGVVARLVVKKGKRR